MKKMAIVVIIVGLSTAAWGQTIRITPDPLGGFTLYGPGLEYERFRPDLGGGFVSENYRVTPDLLGGWSVRHRWRGGAVERLRPDGLGGWRSWNLRIRPDGFGGYRVYDRRPAFR